MAAYKQPINFSVSASDVELMYRFYKSNIVQEFEYIDEYLVNYAFCLVLSVTLFASMMYLHLSFWTKPAEHMKIGVIISIPAIFSIVSYTLMQLDEDCKTLFLVLDCIKHCCAAFAIVMFMSLGQTYLKVSPQDFLHKFEGRFFVNAFPVTLLQPRYAYVNQDYPKFLKYCTWQVMPVSLVCSFSMILLQIYGMYPVWLRWTFFCILNASASLAFSTVFAFSLAFVEKFPPHMLLARLYYIRLIFFLCICQGGILKVLVAMGVIESNHFSDKLVVVEMMLLSILQFCAFFPGFSVSQSPPQTKSTKSAAVAQQEPAELAKIHEPYGVSLSSFEMKSTELAVIAQHEHVELKKSPAQYNFSQPSRLMKSTKLAGTSEPKPTGESRKSSGAANLERKPTGELRKSPLGSSSVSQFTRQMNSTKSRRKSPGLYNGSQLSPDEKALN